MGTIELGATVLRVGAALDVAELLELVDETSDDLLVTARQAGKLRCPHAILVQIGQHSPMTRMQVVVAGNRETGKELFLKRKGELSRQNPQIRAELLTFPAAFRGSHQLRRYQRATILD